MAKKKRDLKREYETFLARGGRERYKTVGARLKAEDVEKLKQVLQENNCKTLGEFLRKNIL